MEIETQNSISPPHWKRITIFLCSISGVLIWLLQSKALLSGFWTLPLGMFELYFSLFSVVFSLIGFVYLAEVKYLLLLSVNLLLFVEPFSWSKTQTDDRLAIISWNVSGSNKETPFNEEKLPCVLNYLSNWKDQSNRQVLFLQEVPKSHKEQYESALSMQCYWAHYLCTQEKCNGLLLCADKEWRFTLEQQRRYSSEQNYGFLQLELEDQKTKQKINALNIHLESLWRTFYNNPQVQKHPSIWKTIHSNPSPRLLLDILSTHSKQQRNEIDDLFQVLNQLKDPVLLAGDFNSPPSLWFHRKLRSQLRDAHKETGFGFGHTNTRFGLLASRIDYLYASPELTWSANTVVDYKASCSDHYPLSSYLDWSPH